MTDEQIRDLFDEVAELKVMLGTSDIRKAVLRLLSERDKLLTEIKNYKDGFKD